MVTGYRIELSVYCSDPFQKIDLFKNWLNLNELAIQTLVPIRAFEMDVADYIAMCSNALSSCKDRCNIEMMKSWSVDSLNYFGFHSWKWSNYLTPLIKLHPWKENDFHVDINTVLDQRDKSQAISKAKNWNNSRGHWTPTGIFEDDIKELKELILWRRHPKNLKLWCYSKKIGGSCSVGKATRREHCIELLEVFGENVPDEASMRKWKWM